MTLTDTRCQAVIECVGDAGRPIGGRCTAADGHPNDANPATRGSGEQKRPTRVPLREASCQFADWSDGGDTETVNIKASKLSLADRLEIIASGTDITDEELRDLAEYNGEVDGHTNELGTKFADFAANVKMLFDPATPEDERPCLRAALIRDAESSAAVLRSLASLTEAIATAA